MIKLSTIWKAIVITLMIGVCWIKATAQSELRTCQSELDLAKYQLQDKDREILSLKDKVADLLPNEALYDECLKDIINKMDALQSIAFILGDKKCARRKVREINDIINQQ